VATPSSTYRLQVNHDFTLNDAAGTVDYLAELGVGAVYLSPVLQSTTGSAHGYDTTDVTRVDRDRGGADGLQDLFARAAAAGLGVVIDIVPNHLGIAVPAENPAWWDVLKLGEESAYAKWFDIDWSRGRIVVPILGDDPILQISDGELHYAEHRFPLAPGSWQPGDDPNAVHDRQHYQLIHHSRGNAELNYRRFFAIASLAGVRVEDREVFDATHALVRTWVSDDGIAGLRIDHPDGLVDPAGYLKWLREIAPDQWIVVEKILEPGEILPTDWPVAGSTGYDAMREVNGLFIDPEREAAFTHLYQQLTGDHRTIGEHIEAGKRMVATEMLPAEVRRMAALAPEVADAGPAIAEVAVAFEVYRSYLPAGVADLDHALEVAARRRPGLASALQRLAPRLHDHRDELAIRMQQLSGATMAKGVEDTAYYRYGRFIALNDVGGNPAQFGVPLAEFHALQAARQDRQPESMTSLSTHDTKRGEDVRARLAVLSEIPAEWAAFAEQFLTATALPSRTLGYFFAQTLAGTGLVERSRLHDYAEKAMREAGEDTSWAAPNEAFEDAGHAAVDLAYDDPELRAAWERLDALITLPGRSNALGQKLVQLTMPGVPDVYQGTELWDDSLVDPDNRRLVDYSVRRRLLAATSQIGPDLPPAAKLRVTSRALRLRRDRPELFNTYLPMTATGPASDHVVAFDRGGAITVATRLPVRLAAVGGWRATTLSLDVSYRDGLSERSWSGEVRLAEVLAELPVALLVRRP
jgi:(1->4)-alpha-D-glucan 1-alpha-D-glucosylmutase